MKVYVKKTLDIRTIRNRNFTPRKVSLNFGENKTDLPTGLQTRGLKGLSIKGQRANGVNGLL